MTGLEAQEFNTDGLTNNGGAAYNTSIVRTGAASIRCNASSGGSASFFATVTPAGWPHFGFYLTTIPSVQRLMYGIISAGVFNLRLNSDGTLSCYINTTLIGTSTIALVTGRYYWIGIRQDAGTTVSWVQVDGVDAIIGTGNNTNGNKLFGFSGTEASAVDAYFDDIIFEGGGVFLPPSKVGLLVPTADSAGGTGWTLGTGTALGGNGFNAVDNKPPTGVADLQAGSDPKQIRNASSNANVSYDATLQTYTVGGVTAGATILAVQPVIATASPSATTPKQGTVGNVSNPAITNIALGAGGVAGAFYSGVVEGTYPTGWKVSFGTMTASPSVTLGTAPVMRITQVTSSALVAVVAFMGLLVAWTPAPIIDPMGMSGFFGA